MSVETYRVVRVISSGHEGEGKARLAKGDGQGGAGFEDALCEAESALDSAEGQIALARQAIRLARSISSDALAIERITEHDDGTRTVEEVNP